MAKLKPIEQHTAVALKKVQESQPVPSHVFLPPAMRKIGVFNGTPPDIKQQVARIEGEADPVGLLVAIAIGQPVPRFDVDDEGNITPTYETLPLANRYRLKVIEYLADKVLQGRVTKEQSSVDQGWAAALRLAAEAAEDDE
jgi:hypothetical protein